MTADRREILKGAAAAVALAALNRPARATQITAPLAQTSYGPVRGTLDEGIAVFKGIRYGADTAPRRFQAPLPPTPWSDPVDATAFGAASPQKEIDEAVSEDCLFLNVWTPGLDAGRRPVMVYLHGGAYTSGSGSHPLLDGRRLAARGDVVVVTLNHRLNLFGYAYLARFGDSDMLHSGNAGTLDLVLALAWLRDNIAAFGGDPGQVMLFGQSGGGAKIATLMAVPAAAGLFHRAATMSGQQLTASGPLNATKRAAALLDTLGLKPERVSALRALPVATLTAALDTIDPIIGSGRLYFGPVLDERTLLRHPFYPDAPGQSAAIPMMLGNTHDETRSLIGGNDDSAFKLGWSDLPERLIAHMRVDIAPETVIAEYRRLYPGYAPSDVFFAATTASRSWRAAVVEAELRAAQRSPAFVYQLDWPSPLDGGKWGAPHTHDIALVFGTLDARGSYTGTGEAARAMSERLMDTFIAFARTGNPNSPALPRWEPYELPRRQTMVFDTATRLEDDPRGAERRLFARVPFIQQGT
ncbi:Para-nitrobenzyl esterase [Alphaproteobacteria bacterium SO-S41]|nr:Para-nitrobenzyl esterase [Alphaproteobacteria bacterium SO-S41]